MKVIGISSSPRKGGNSDILLDAAIEGVESAGGTCEKVFLRDLDFEGCSSCGRCRDNGVCAVRDDMQSIYARLKKADALIVASPIFFGSLTGQLKIMIDRFECSWIVSHLLNKPVLPGKRRRGLFICVAGESKIKYFANARQIIRYFFRTLNISYSGELFCGGVAEKGAVRKRRDIMKKAFLLGASLAGKTR